MSYFTKINEFTPLINFLDSSLEICHMCHRFELGLLDPTSVARPDQHLPNYLIKKKKSYNPFKSQAQ